MAKSQVRSVMRLLGPILLVWIIWRFADLPVLVETFARASSGPIIAAILLNALVIHANPGQPPAVSDSVKLLKAVRAGPRPAVNGVKAGFGQTRCESGCGGLPVRTGKA